MPVKDQVQAAADLHIGSICLCLPILWRLAQSNETHPMRNSETVEAVAEAIYREFNKRAYVGQYKFYGDDTCLDGQFDLSEIAQAAISCLETLGWKAVPEGWTLVPVEPTPEMVQAAQYPVTYNYSYHGVDPPPRVAWQRMLSSLPTSPTEEKTDKP